LLLPRRSIWLYLWGRILNCLDLERAEERRQIDHVARG
jgi:hypothetical protein